VSMSWSWVTFQHWTNMSKFSDTDWILEVPFSGRAISFISLLLVKNSRYTDLKAVNYTQCLGFGKDFSIAFYSMQLFNITQPPIPINVLQLMSYFVYWDFTHSSSFCFGICQTLDACIKLLVLVCFLRRNLESLVTPMNNSYLPRIGGLGPSMKGRRTEGAKFSVPFVHQSWLP
jgi:hypothetical protein